MDVRCEKCLTVYEFDDSQVTPQGVTVKCTQCGNLFKVKRRNTAEFAPGALERARQAQSQAPARPSGDRAAAPAPTQPPPAQPRIAPQPVVRPPDPSLLVRLQLSGEVYKAPDLGVVADWIQQRKVTRDDLLSRDHATWQPLGQVPELRPVFDELESPPTVQEAEIPLALTTTAPMDPPTGPTQMGSDGPHIIGDAAFATTEPKQRVTGPSMPSIPSLSGDFDDDLELPRKKSAWTYLLFLFVLAVGGAGGYAYFYRPDLLKRFIGGGRAEKAYRAGLDKLQLDTDDGYRQSVELFAEAHGADADDPLPLAGLAEAESSWAWYLRDDAHALEAAGPQAQAAAATLRKEAQGHLDDAKKAAADALAIAPDAPEVNRAMADFLRVDGAPAAEVERYLKRALEHALSDADALFVSGALAYREGQKDQARTQLSEALKQAQAANRPLYRGSYLLAKLALDAGRKDEARQLLDGVLGPNPQHERARALLAQLGSAPAATADAGSVAAASTSPAPPTTAPAPPAPVAKAPAPTAPVAKAPAPDAKVAAVDEPVKPGDYNKLVAQADRLSENGHGEQARKLYEKALAANPSGVEAIAGLGYCDLDKERFLSAIDRFRQALNVAPDYGDALIGIAEAYKVQGNKAQAIEHYQRYLKALPHGPKAAMAQKNIRDLQPRERTEPAPSEPPSAPTSATPSSDTTTADPDKPAPLPRLPSAPPAPDDSPTAAH